MANDILVHEEINLPEENLPEENLETRDVIDYEGNVIGNLSLKEGTSEEIWINKLSQYSSEIISPTVHQIVQKKIEDSQIFGIQLMNNFATENVLTGITQSGKTIDVTNYLHKLSHYLSTGSLYAALTEMDTIIADETKGYLAPFVTNDRIEIYKLKIQNYLGF